MAMTLVERLERLVCFVPGAAGYQGRKNRRETDRLVRARLAHDLRLLAREVEAGKRRLMEAGELALLPVLDRVAGKLERLGRAAAFPGRGNRRMFDVHELDQKTLDRLYHFDVGLFERVESLKARARQVSGASQDREALRRAGDAMEIVLDDFELAFDKRRHILTAG